MKIAIVSDLHIGYERFYEDAYSQASEALVEAAKLADAILLPGDIFDKRAPKPEVMAQAINIFRKLDSLDWQASVESFSGNGRAYTKVPIIAISGTHERTAEGKENPLGLLALAGLLVDTSESSVVLNKGGERVAIFGLGGLSEERVAEKLKELDPKPVENAFNIFVFHQSIYEILPFDKTFIHYDDLPEGFDLYVCGHVHSRLTATVYGKPFLIPGSTVLTQLKEGETEKKGFIIFDTEKHTHEFVYINSRPFVVKHLKFTGSSVEEVRKRCDAEITDCVDAAKGQKPIVKLYLEGTFELGGSSELGLHGIAARHNQEAIVDIDSSALREPELEKGIEAIRDGKIDDIGIKDMGMQMLRAALKESGFPETIDISELFEILSDTKISKKEKVMENALQFINAA